MKEAQIERYLVKRVKALGGEVRKVQWVGRRNAPDRLVLIYGAAYWVELKAPGKKPRIGQQREIERLRGFGQRALVIDSLAGVDEIVRP